MINLLQARGGRGEGENNAYDYINLLSQMQREKVSIWRMPTRFKFGEAGVEAACGFGHRSLSSGSVPAGAGPVPADTPPRDETGV